MLQASISSSLTRSPLNVCQSTSENHAKDDAFNTSLPSRNSRSMKENAVNNNYFCYSDDDRSVGTVIVSFILGVFI